MRFFSLGSSAYPNFAAFGKHLDNSLHILGGHRITSVGTGDELDNQEGSFKDWMNNCFLKLCKELNIETEVEATKNKLAVESSDSEQTIYRWRSVEKKKKHLCKELEKTHKVEVKEMILTDREYLHSQADQPATIMVTLDLPEDQLQYHTGDHLGIIPHNTKEDVQVILRHLENVPALDAPIVLENRDFDEKGWQ